MNRYTYTVNEVKHLTDFLARLKNIHHNAHMISVVTNQSTAERSPISVIGRDFEQEDNQIGTIGNVKVYTHWGENSNFLITVVRVWLINEEILNYHLSFREDGSVVITAKN